VEHSTAELSDRDMVVSRRCDVLRRSAQQQLSARHVPFPGQPLSLPSLFNRGGARNLCHRMRRELGVAVHRAEFPDEVPDHPHRSAAVLSSRRYALERNGVHQPGVPVDGRERRIVGAGQSKLRTGRGISECRHRGKLGRDPARGPAPRKRESTHGFTGSGAMPLRTGDSVFASVVGGWCSHGCSRSRARLCMECRE
jgi:hypothetical protein